MVLSARGEAAHHSLGMQKIRCVREEEYVRTNLVQFTRYGKNLGNCAI